MYNPIEMDDKSKNILMKMVGTMDEVDIPAKWKIILTSIQPIAKKNPTLTVILIFIQKKTVNLKVEIDSLKN